MAGAILCFLLLPPGVTALGFETYFVARLLGAQLRNGNRQADPQ